MKEILKLFTSEDIKEIRDSVKSIILKQVSADIENYDEYIFVPSDAQDIISEAFNEVVEEVKEEFKVKIREKMEKRFENLNF